MVSFLNFVMMMQALPGGKQDEADNKDDVLTALRETKEEVGLDFLNVWEQQKIGTTATTSMATTTRADEEDDVRVLCLLPTLESINHLCVTPVVAVHTQKNWTELYNLLTINRDEVQAAFFTPLRYFVETTPTEIYEVPWSKSVFVYRHYDYSFRYETQHQTFAITGLTAHIVHQVASIMYSDDDHHPHPPQNANHVSSGTTTTTTMIHLASPTSNISTVVVAAEFHGFLQRKLMRASSATYTPKNKWWWSKHYYVLVNNNSHESISVLHQYDSPGQAQRKRHTANKKNRLRLEGMDSDKFLAVREVEPDDDDDDEDNNNNRKEGVPKKCRVFPFEISTFEGRVKWQLAASSEEERRIWIDRIRSAAYKNGKTTTT
jgi:8-oxo-dGTP pyrophosphatase MutT (NUDIX family)